MEKEAGENELHQQLEERDQQIANLQIQLRKLERKLERQLGEKDNREELLQRDLKEMEQQLQK